MKIFANPKRLAGAAMIFGLLGAVAGLALVADELTLCDSPAGFIPLVALPYVVAGWALFSAGAAVTGFMSGRRQSKDGGQMGLLRSKDGVVIGLIDLFGLPVLWFVATIIHVAQCIG